TAATTTAAAAKPAAEPDGKFLIDAFTHGARVVDAKRVLVIDQIVRPNAEERVAARSINVGHERAVQQKGVGGAAAIQNSPIHEGEEGHLLFDDRSAEIEVVLLLTEIGLLQSESVARVERRIAKVHP